MSSEDSNASVLVWRILDANANRAAEGLRVVEEYARFILNDGHLTGLYKQLRHDVNAVVTALPGVDTYGADLIESHPPGSLASELSRPGSLLIESRDTSRDVGTTQGTAAEYERKSSHQVAAASQKRAEQALRCLEEYSKRIDGAVAGEFESLRYRLYTLGKALSTTDGSVERLRDVHLYVLLDGRGSVGDFELAADELIAGGADMIQLRDKRLPDREILDRAKRLRDATRRAGKLMIVNDRPDIAALCHADGVHVGQDELSVFEARRIMGVGRLVGVSTHSIEQARQAVLDGADYIGCGPTFPSGTKHFAEFPGVEFLRQVSAEIRLPSFAIGGVTLERLPEVLEAGFNRVAVGGAVLDAASLHDAASELKARLGRS